MGAFGHLGRLPASVKNAPGAFGAFGHIFDSIFSADFRVHLGIYAEGGKALTFGRIWAAISYS